MHFAFHPAGGSPDNFAGYDGYLELAATNELIVVYTHSDQHNSDGSVPQADGLHLTKDGLYPKAVKAMICRVTSTQGTNDCPMGASAITSVAFALIASLSLLQ